MTITTGSIPKHLAPGLKGQFTGIVNDEKSVWRKIFKIVPSQKKYEEIISIYSMGLVDVKPEGSSMTYDNFSQGLTIRHTHKSYGKGCIITREAKDDDLYWNLAEKAIKYLGQSHRTTEEYVHANIFNNGFTVANNHQEGGDGQYLFDSDHTLKSGTFSNLLASASLSRTALQDAITQVQGIKDESGQHFSALEPKQLVVPLALQWEAKEILKSMYHPDDANNAVNNMYDVLPLIVWKYLSSNTAWFLTTNAPDGFVHYNRVKQEVRQSNDDDTMNSKIQSYSRYISGVVDVRGGFGNTGA